MDRAFEYALALAKALSAKYYPDNHANWKPFDTTLGLLTQIDNMIAGLGKPFTHPAAIKESLTAQSEGEGAVRNQSQVDFGLIEDALKLGKERSIKRQAPDYHFAFEAFARLRSAESAHLANREIAIQNARDQDAKIENLEAEVARLRGALGQIKEMIWELYT